MSCVPDDTTCLSPISVSASLPPWSAITSYGFSVSFGMKYTVWPFFRLVAPNATPTDPITTASAAIPTSKTVRLARGSLLIM